MSVLLLIRSSIEPYDSFPTNTMVLTLSAQSLNLRTRIRHTSISTPEKECATKLTVSCLRFGHVTEMTIHELHTLNILLGDNMKSLAGLGIADLYLRSIYVMGSKICDRVFEGLQSF